MFNNVNKYIIIGTCLAVVLVSESVLTGFLPHTRGYLFELLGAKAGPIWLAIFIYFINYLFLSFFQSIKAYVVLSFSLIFRSDRTRSISKLNIKNVSNVSQRIQEDIKWSYHERITVWCEYLISGTILIQLIILNLSQPILVISSIGYAILSVCIAMRFNPRLTYAEKLVQDKEATFRAALSINFLNVVGLKDANKASMKAGAIRMQYYLFTQMQFGLINVLPYIVLVPKLLSGEIDLGELVKHQATFALIVVNAAILIQLYPRLIQGRASEERVKELEGSKDD